MLRLSERQAKQLGLMEHELTDVQAGEPGPERVRGASAEDLFAQQCVTFRLPPSIRQHPFALGIGRKWRFDFAFIEQRVAVEIDGVVVRRIGGQLVVGGRHATITGIRGDNDKMNHASMLGWSVARFLQTDVKSRSAVEMTMRILIARGWRGANGLGG